MVFLRRCYLDRVLNEEYYLVKGRERINRDIVCGVSVWVIEYGVVGG